MQNYPLLKRIYYRYLGQIYAFAYATHTRRFLGIRQSNWLKRISLLLLLLGWVRGWDTWSLLLLLLLSVWLHAVDWQARRAGYSKFIAAGPVAIATAGLQSLPPNQRIQMRATGLFSLSDREDYLLLRPAEYWQVPLGAHVVMAQYAPGSFRYQFFSAGSLLEVQHGWLIFGPRPLKTLAISFLVTWGPGNDDTDQLYYVTSDDGHRPDITKRTIYFTFTDETKERAVWHNIVRDARRVRT